MRTATIAKENLRLVTIGCNVSGALGRGEVGQTALAVAGVVPTPPDDPPIQVSAGWGHTAFVTRSGKLVACGRAFDMRNILRFGKLAKSRPNLAYIWTKYLGAAGSIDFVEPTIVSGTFECTKVSASAGLTLAITRDGKAIAFGANRYGQTGVVDAAQEAAVMNAKQVQFPGKVGAIVDIAAGHQHACAVDDQGDLYVWGKSDRGQAGFGDDSVKSSPIREPKLLARIDQHGVKAVACGFSHCAVLTKSGRVFTWGKGQENDGKTDVLEPRMIPNLPSIAEISCGQYHTLARDVSGNIYQWGLRPSELGGDFVGEPQLVSGVPSGALGLSCGINESCVLSDGVPYIWTWKDPQPRPFEVLSDFKVHQVAFGWRHIVALVE